MGVDPRRRLWRDSSHLDLSRGEVGGERVNLPTRLLPCNTVASSSRTPQYLRVTGVAFTPDALFEEHGVAHLHTESCFPLSAEPLLSRRSSRAQQRLAHSVAAVDGDPKRLLEQSRIEHRGQQELEDGGVVLPRGKVQRGK